MLGSSTRYGHGGMAALEAAHAGLALGLPTLLSPRLSSADARPRHLVVSHHTRAVLELVLAGVGVPVPAASDGLWPTESGGAGGVEELVGACGERHRPTPGEADLDGYAASGLSRRTMGRDLYEDRLFFAAALAAGSVLAALVPSG
jgi:hypothetical protein